MNFNSKKIIFIIVLQCFAICIHAQVSTAPVVVITPANAATASLAAAQAVWVNITTTGFSINTNATAVVSSTGYKWNYVVIQ